MDHTIGHAFPKVNKKCVYSLVNTREELFGEQGDQIGNRLFKVRAETLTIPTPFRSDGNRFGHILMGNANSFFKRFAV